jgi:hypothetical protein
VSDRRSRTSPANGAKSQGPITLEGKRVSSGNARSHGILSRELLLPSEDPAEFNQLLDELASELRPVGTLEHTLVERIAIAMWRQRRLVRAENARVLRLQNNGTTPSWRETVDVVGERRSIHEATALLNELTIIANNHLLKSLPISEFNDRYPQAFALLLETLGPPDPVVIDPAEGDVAIGDYYLNLTGWAMGQMDLWKVKQDAILRRDVVCVPNDSDKLSRYQSSLDNELYKAMRALRQAQSWRLDVLEPKE